MHAGLVQDDVRNLRQPVFDILNPAVTDDLSSECSSGFQNVASLTQYASFNTRSLNPKASNISMVRQAMPSAWPASADPISARLSES